jgi:DNA-binding NtrC family response regulator
MEENVSISRNILIVDDNADQCDILANLVSEIGHKAYTATDGQMALQMLITGFPSSETILRTIENDGYTYLVKPVKLKSMANLIEKAFSDPMEG